MNRYIDPAAREALERRVRIEDARELRRDRALTLGFWAVMVGLLLAGVIGILSTPPIAGIG